MLEVKIYQLWTFDISKPNISISSCLSDSVHCVRGLNFRVWAIYRSFGNVRMLVLNNIYYV